MLHPQLGGNSLQAGAVCSRLRTALGGKRSIPVVWLLECQTVEALAERLAEATEAGAAGALPPLLPTVSQQSDSSTLTPLTFQQVLPSAGKTADMCALTPALLLRLLHCC